jgi:elongation factor Ts
MAISTEMVQQLRQCTGAGVLECKKALEQSQGNQEEAVKILRTKGIAQAEKKASRSTKQGLIATYLHLGGQLGVLVEVNCETDFVARTDDFQNLTHDLAMQVAAANPIYVKREDIPAEIIEKEKEIARSQVAGKPANVAEKIIAGKLEKFYEQFCLVDQPFIKDDKIKINDYLKSSIAKIGENIVIKRFARFKLGEE